MLKIMGVDPGSQITGYGIIEKNAQKMTVLTNGSIIAAKIKSQEDRLAKIFTTLQTLIKTYKPDVIVVEKIFYALNVKTSLILAQVRGVILLSCSLEKVKLCEYSPREIKQAVTGKGSASKEQVVKMLHLLLKTPLDINLDESDALAAAVCYANQANLKQIIK